VYSSVFAFVQNSSLGCYADKKIKKEVDAGGLIIGPATYNKQDEVERIQGIFFS
jgi:hypothetical protein